MVLNEAVTTRMQRLLQERGWTANELIKRSGVNQSTLAEIMAGRSKHPRIITIKNIAKGFGMSLSEFFNDELFEEDLEA